MHEEFFFYHSKTIIIPPDNSCECSTIREKFHIIACYRSKQKQKRKEKKYTERYRQIVIPIMCTISIFELSYQLPLMPYRIHNVLSFFPSITYLRGLLTFCFVSVAPAVL